MLLQMRRFLLCISMAACFGVAAWSQEQGGATLPGAEGFGARAKGGVDGKVIWVTNLNADGPGSLRAAVDTPGPRIVKFKVAGTIELKRDTLGIGQPFRQQWRARTEAGEVPGPSPYSYLTVDGASAPSPGITISGKLSIACGASHIILRHLRIRENGYVSRAAADCITVTDGCTDILIDHCSLTWARDETVNFWGSCSDMTLQWCIVEGYGPHGYGFLNGAGTDRITVHHNLIPHNMARSPRIGGNVGRFADRTFPNPHPIIDVQNNVIYNWHNVGATTIDFAAHVNLVRNLYLPGPSTDPSKLCITMTKKSVLYLEGNISPNRPDDEHDEWADAGHFGEAPEYESISGPWEEGLRAEQPFPAPPVAMHTVEEARELVLAQAGAWPRDPIDAGIIRTVLDGTGYAGVMNGVPEDFTNARPTPSASAEGTSNEVTFGGKASDLDGKIVSYTWDFGDGQSGVGQTTTHSYRGPGEYVATLVAMDDRGMTGTAELRLQVRMRQRVVAEPIPSSPITELQPPKPPDVGPPAKVTVPRIAAGVAAGQFPVADAWQRAPRLLPFVMQGSWRKAADEEADARVVHDGARLYLRVISDEPNPRSIRPFQEGTEPERWGHGSVEMYLSAEWGEKPWYHFIVHTSGRTYDARQFEREWDPPAGWYGRSRTEGDKWVLEVAIPFASLEMPGVGSGSRLGLKLCRYRAKDEILLWPSLSPEPDGRYCVVYRPDPTGYAQLVLD